MAKKQEQLILSVPEDKKETRVTIKLNHADVLALNKGIERVGETNMSSYIRRLIHANKSSI